MDGAWRQCQGVHGWRGGDGRRVGMIWGGGGVHGGVVYRIWEEGSGVKGKRATRAARRGPTEHRDDGPFGIAKASHNPPRRLPQAPGARSQTPISSRPPRRLSARSGCLFLGQSQRTLSADETCAGPLGPASRTARVPTVTPPRHRRHPPGPPLAHHTRLTRPSVLLQVAVLCRPASFLFSASPSLSRPFPCFPLHHRCLHARV